METSCPEDATRELLVEIESFGDDQCKTREIHPVPDVANKRQSISVASSSHHGRWPESKLHFARDEDPR